jgi:DNA polymerase-3 subunit delta'
VSNEAEHKGDSEAVGIGARRSRDAAGVSFDALIEQGEAKHLLGAALAEGPAHAYLFHGPAGVGKQTAAIAFAGELLGDRDRTERRSHPDLYVLEPLGDQIRIDEVRELRRDLHMRPFEADRRVYLVFGAHLLNAEAADALLKDLEEPPPYAVVVLVADELGSLPETIRSRCQLVPFRRLSERAVRAEVDRRAPTLSPDQATAVARVAGGRIDRVERLLDPDAARRRDELLAVARSVYADVAFDPHAAAQTVLGLASERAAAARAAAEQALATRDLPEREADQHVRRVARGAEREEILLALEELAAWYRDLVVVAAGAERAVIHFDRLAELSADASVERMLGAERAAEAVRETWRAFEEFNVSPPLALEALFVRVWRELGGAVSVPG